MKKIVALIVMFSAICASPVPGAWIYEGTTTWISEPGSAADPNGTWWCWWDGEGSVSGGALSLQSQGWTQGEAGVNLWPYFGDGFGAASYVYSGVDAASYYRWDPNTGGSKNIYYTVITSVNPGTGIVYGGRAIDDTHVNTVTCISDGGATVGGGVSTDGPLTTSGSCHGQSITQSGSSATNNSGGGAIVSKDEEDYGYPAPALYNQWHEGALEFTGGRNETRACLWDETMPWIMYFSISTSVSGSAWALGDIDIIDDDYYYLRLAARVIYYTGGTALVTLSGNIQ